MRGSFDGKFKRLSSQQKSGLCRRQAIESAIGHLKSDHRMDRCWLHGALGDALHGVGCAAGFNVRWLLRAIAGWLGPLFLRAARGAVCGTQPRDRVYRWSIAPMRLLNGLNYRLAADVREESD